MASTSASSAVLALPAARGGDAVAHGPGLAVERVVEELALEEVRPPDELRGEVRLVERVEHVGEPLVERAAVEPVEQQGHGGGKHEHAADKRHGGRVEAVDTHDERDERERRRAHDERNQPVGDVCPKRHLPSRPDDSGTPTPPDTPCRAW